MRRAQLVWELAENLHRLDLTKDQRDQHIRRYVELIELRSAKPVQCGQVSGGRGSIDPIAPPIRR
jgi:hypothetical protein